MITILNGFVVFEGIDGSGTTTQLKILEDRLRGKSVWFTCEPTDTAVGKLLRQALKGDCRLQEETMARLFAADRCEHLFSSDGIIQRCTSGQIVFCDRYLFSSLAYQGNPEIRQQVASQNADFPLPEYLFFFDINPDTALERVDARGGTKEIYETTDFQHEVSKRYRQILDDYSTMETGMKIITIDASLPVETIAEKIWSIVGNLPKIR